MSISKKSVTSLAAAMLLGCFMGSASAGEDEVFLTVGTKIWNNKWTSWDYYNPIPNIAGSSENFTSNSKSVFIPSLSLRYQDFLVTGSLFSKREYGFTGVKGINFYGKRDEADIHVGYYILPTLAITAGYKEVKQDFGNEFKYSGPVIGLMGSSPLSKNFSMYGHFAYGGMNANFPSNVQDSNGKTSFKANYYLSEIGLAYSLDAKSILPSVKAITATIGYRSQTLATQDFAVGIEYNNPNNWRSTELRDNTEGLAIGLSLTF